MHPIVVVTLLAPVHEFEVDALETNHVAGRFVQSVAWERVNGAWVDRGYVVHTETNPGRVHVYGDRFRLVVHRCGRWHVVTSRVHLVRMTGARTRGGVPSGGRGIRAALVARGLSKTITN